MIKRSTLKIAHKGREIAYKLRITMNMKQTSYGHNGSKNDIFPRWFKQEKRNPGKFYEEYLKEAKIKYPNSYFYEIPERGQD